MVIMIDFTDPTCTMRPTPDLFNKLYSRAELEQLFGPVKTYGDLLREGRN